MTETDTGFASQRFFFGQEGQVVSSERIGFFAG